MGGKAKQPKAPDPYKTAEAQTQSNIATAQANAQLNRINETNPFGSSTYTNNNGTWSRDTTYSPLVQQGIDQSLGLTAGAGAAANQMLGSLPTGSINPQTQMQSGYNFGSVNSPTMATGFNTPNSSQFYEQAGVISNRAPDLQTVTGNVSYGGLPSLNRDYSKEREQVINALQGRYNEALGTRYGDQERALENQLANRGLVQGSEAYNRALSQFNTSRDKAYQDALTESILTGGNEQSRLFGMDLSSRQQLAGERQFAANLAQNAAMANNQNQFGLANLDMARQGQGFNQALARDQNAYNQALQQAQFGNNALNQQFGNELQAANFGAQNALQNAQLANQANQMQFNQGVQNQQMPWQQLQQLYGMTNPTIPQFGATPTVSQQGTDLAGLIQNNYANQAQLYGANQQLLGSIIGSGGNLLGNLIPFM